MSLKTLAAACIAAAFLFPAPDGRAAELKAWTGPTPALELKDLEGKTHRLDAYRGKVVVLNFWATWCEPCRDEMPSLNRLRKSLEGQPVVLFAVNYGEGEARITEFLKKVPVDLPVLLDRDSQVGRAWRVRLMPTTYIVGTDGRIRYGYAGERDWDDDAIRARIAALAKERAGR
jgi:cytochrome c biogenesis protein CcmG/thiol:disulfide interchange protein DsbE